MKQNVIVIGAQYGDEGKGRTVDHFASTLENPLVVRFNGGAQAGHTVWLNENAKHVFHTFGSGTFRGANTYLTSHFVFDPFAALEEQQELKLIGYSPKLIVSARCKMVTIYDILYNQIKESLKEHGSCGMGISAAIDRHETIPFKVFDVFDEIKVKETLQDIHDYYECRINEIIYNIDGYENFPSKVEDFYNRVMNKNFRDTYYKIFIETFNVLKLDIEVFDHVFENGDDAHTFFSKHSLIFEGAQGLMLDEYYGDFPHVTRSRTGSHNVVDFCRKYDIKIDHVYYVTRCYTTRHGKAPNFKSWPHIDLSFNIVDDTNIKNQWQGDMQFSYLNLHELAHYVKCDMSISNGKHFSIVMTCIDQMKGDRIPNITYYLDGTYSLNDQYRNLSIDNFQKRFSQMIGHEIGFMTFANKVNGE